MTCFPNQFAGEKGEWTGTLDQLADVIRSTVGESKAELPFLNRHSPDARAFWATFGPVGARRNEIRAVADCASNQIAGLVASKSWNASLACI